jgi:hypothetical protein
MKDWNYRIVLDDLDELQNFHLCLVYYDKDGRPTAWTPATISGETVPDVISTIALVNEAVSKPTLSIKKDFAHAVKD